MCGNCKDSNGKCGAGCIGKMIAKILVIIGGINWGLVGIGVFFNSDLNLVKMILGSMPTLEAIVYLLVGVSAVMMIFGCKCRKCVGGACANCNAEPTKPEETM